MKKTQKTALTAAMFAAAMNMSACGAADNEAVTGTGYKAGGSSDIAINVEYNPELEIQQDVYGPPPTTEPPTTTMVTTVYGPPYYDTTTEPPTETMPPPTTVPEPVYGPPYFDTTTEPPTSEPPTSEPPTTEPPTATIPPTTVPPVYGPPIYFKGDVNGDFMINSLDVVALRKGLVNGIDTGRISVRYTVDGYLTADLNEDGIVSVSDLVQLQKFILGEIKDFDNHFGEFQGAYGPPPDYKEDPSEPPTEPAPAPAGLE